MADEKREIALQWFRRDPPKPAQSKTSHRRRNSLQVNNNNNTGTSIQNSSQSSTSSATSPPNPFPTTMPKSPHPTPSRLANQRRPSLFTQNSYNKNVQRNVTICGPMGVGKTSICKVLCQPEHSKRVADSGSYQPTHEDEYMINTKIQDEDLGEKNIQLTILDTQGSDNPDLHNRCPQQFVTEKDGFIVVYDVNCDKSFTSAKEFLSKLIFDNNVQPDECGILLVGNKTDKKKGDDDLGYDDRIEEALEFCEEMDLELEPQFISATRGDEVQGIFTTLCQHIETLKQP
jgi:small GTP-binding protein